MHEWGGFAFLSFIVVVCWTAAAIVYAGGPRNPGNRLLAALLLFQGFAESVSAVRRLHDFPALVGGTSTGLSVVFFVSVLTWTVLYYFFLGTLRSRLASPLRSPVVRFALVTYWAVVAGLAILRPNEVIPATAGRPPSLLIIVPLVIVSVYGLLIAIEMVRRTSPGGLERRQAFAYLAAFGIRDLGFLVFGLMVLSSSVVTYPEATRDVVARIPALVNLAAAVLLTYGVLVLQLLDIDLKIKWGIRRGTLLAIFVAAFVATSEIVSDRVTDQAGLWVGIVTTMVLVLAIGPLQRLADRLADRAMPHVADTAEYRLVRRQELYAAAVRSALQDGVVTERERHMLATLADELGLSSREALALEQAARGSETATE